MSPYYHDLRLFEVIYIALAWAGVAVGAVLWIRLDRKGITVRRRPIVLPALLTLWWVVELLLVNLAWRYTTYAQGNVVYYPLKLADDLVFLVIAPALTLLSAAAFFRKRSLRGMLFGLLGIGLLALGWYIHYYEPYNLQVRQYEIVHPRLDGLERPLKIALIADLQTDVVGEYTQRAIETAYAEKPDAVFYLGDYIHERHKPSLRQEAAKLGLMIQEIENRVHRPAFSVAISGDHEWPGWYDIFNSTTVRPLEDKSLTVRLAGVDFRVSALSFWESVGIINGSRGLDVIPEPAPGEFHILLSHRPGVVLKLPPGRCHLVCSGHTHGGQVRLPLVGPLFDNTRLQGEYAGGSHDWEGMRLVVSRGIGLNCGAAPRVRFLCPPEVVILELLGK